MSSNLLVFAILGIAIAFVGVHLILYSRRQSRLIRRFAASEGYPYQDRDDGVLADRLEETFGTLDGGCARTFERIRDVVAVPNGRIFRAVELLDLNPHGSVESSHHARVCVHFSGAPECRGIFHITPALDVSQRFPAGSEPVAGRVREYLERALIAKPPCALSLTVVDGEGLAYLEPLVVGSLAPSHLDYLADLAARSQRSARPV